MKHIFTTEHFIGGNSTGGQSSARQYIFENEEQAKTQCDLIAKHLKEYGFEIKVDEDPSVHGDFVLFSFTTEKDEDYHIVSVQKRDIQSIPRLNDCLWYGYTFTPKEG